VTKYRKHLAVFVLTFMATNARLELAAFVLPLVLNLVLTRRMGLVQALVLGAAGSFGALGT
jgi:hypothetical protein